MTNYIKEQKDIQIIEDSLDLALRKSERDKLVYVGTMGISSGLKLDSWEVDRKLELETGKRPMIGDRIEVWVRWRKKDNFRVGEMIEADVIGPDDVVTKSVGWLEDE